LHHLGSRGQPRVLCPGYGELAALLYVARRAHSACSPVRVLFNREIPHVPCVGTVIPQDRLLSGRREQTVSGHTNTLTTTSDISGGVK
jgi:hypothetical protein